MKKIYIIISSVVLIIAISITLFVINKKDNERKIVLAQNMYQKIENLYTFNDGIEYVTTENYDIASIQQGDKKYYQIKEYKDLTSKIMTKSMTEKYLKYMNIIEFDGKIYLQDIGRGTQGHRGLIFEIKSKTSKKISYTVKMKFCEIEHRTEHNNGCESEEYMYTIDMPFVLIKENDEWKVDQYTSIFEIDDDLIK